MTFYLVLWLGYSCPGGILSGFIPAAAKPLVCRSEAKYEMYDPARIEKAKSRIRELGPAAMFFSCRGFKCENVAVAWTTSCAFPERLRP